MSDFVLTCICLSHKLNKYKLNCGNSLLEQHRDSTLMTLEANAEVIVQLLLHSMATVHKSLLIQINVTLLVNTAYSCVHFSALFYSTEESQVIMIQQHEAEIIQPKAEDGEETYTRHPQAVLIKGGSPEQKSSVNSSRSNNDRSTLSLCGDASEEQKAQQ